MEEKDKIYELQVSGGGIGGKIRIQNSNNRVLAKLGDVLIDKLSWFRWHNAVKALDKYNNLLAARKIAGKETPLPPKFLLEILDNAFIEDDDQLQNLWVNLLINWQDPNQKLDKRPIYINILKSLSSTEVGILSLISEEYRFESIPFDSDLHFSKDNIIKSLNISQSDYQISILNLFRNGCLESFRYENTSISMGGIHPIKDMGIDEIRLTILGYNLIKNCIN